MSAQLTTALAAADAPKRFGAKAANLARLLNTGIRSAPGCVLGVEVLAAHLERLGLTRRVETLFASLESGLAGDPRAEAAQLRQAVQDSALDPGLLAALAAEVEAGVAYAVRSSAPGEDGSEASFAGQFDSVLDCRSVEDVARAICRVWA